MKAFLFLLLATAGTLTATAVLPPDAKSTVTGIVRTPDGRTLEFATVSALTADSTLADGALTDAEGKFTLSVANGTYLFQVEFLGFATTSVEAEVRGATQLDPITITPAGLDLETVEVRADKSRMELKLDKKVFNVGQDALAQGGDATNVLAQVPAVAVSAEGTVSLRGNSGVQILVNGRPSALTASGSLEAIPAASIERVEVITTPSARYEASGSAGIINIILKKDQRRGYGGTVGLSTGFPADHRATVNLNYRHEKINAFANVGGRFANFRGDGELNRTSTLEGRTTNLVRTPDMDRQDRGWSLFTGLDYQLGEEATLTASYARNDVINDDISRNTYEYTLGQGDPLRNLLQTEDYFEPGLYQQADLIYAAGESWTIQLSHDRWAETEDQSVTIGETFPNEVAVVDYRTLSDERSEDYLLQIDHKTPLGEFGRLEVGVRGESRLIRADYFANRAVAGGFEPIPGFNANLFDYNERIGSGYVQYAREREKLNWQVGLRAEYIDITTTNSSPEETDLAKDYLQPFPSASVQYRFRDGLSSQVSYSRRIRRPQFWQLNPFGGIRLPSSIQFGNPDIDPSFTDRVEWNLLWRGEKLTFNPSIAVAREIGAFNALIEQEADNIFGLEDGTITSRPINLGREINFGGEGDLNYRPAEGWQFNFYVLVFGGRQRGTVEGRSLDADFLTWRTNVRGQVELPKDWNVQLRVGYNGYRRDAQTEQLGTFNGNAAVTKQWGKKVTLNLNVYAPRYFRSTTFRPSFRQEDFFQWTGWRVGAGVEYRFEKGTSWRGRRQRGSIRN